MKSTIEEGVNIKNYWPRRFYVQQTRKYFEEAACEGNLEACKEMLTIKCISSIIDINNAFRQAAVEGHLEVCKLLYSFGGVCAPLDKRSSFLLAAEKGHLDVCKYLVKIGSDSTPNVHTAKNVKKWLKTIGARESFWTVLNRYLEFCK